MSARRNPILSRGLAMMAGLLLTSTALVGDAHGQLCQTAQPATYVASYVPSGNYAAVTAFSPPMVEGVPVVANYAPAVAPVVASVPSSSIAVTSYYAPQPVAAVAAPVTTYYAPTAAAYYAPTAAAGPVTAYYSAPVAAPVATAMPVTAYYAPVAPAVVAPVAAYYPPTVVARRGPFGGTRYRYYPGSWYTPY